jgi:hypothetical protein
MHWLQHAAPPPPILDYQLHLGTAFLGAAGIKTK